MVLFIFSCIFGFIALVVFVVAFFTPKTVTVPGRYGSAGREEAVRRPIRFGALAAAVVGLAFLLFASFTTIDTKNVGVLTTFGRPTGYVDNGFHWKAPWQSATELNDAVQTDTYASDGGAEGKKQGGATDTCVNVRIARQATACVNVSVRWQIKPSGVDYLFRNYKDNSAIQDNVVLRDLQQAMNEAFVDYDPLGIDQNGNSTNEPLSATKPGVANLSADVRDQMQSEIGTWIDVQSVIIPLLNFDTQTQARINQLQTQVALTRIAQQSEQTSTAQAAANQALAASVSNDPNVLVSKCLDILQDAVNNKQPLPAGFSCFGPSATSIAVQPK